MALAAILAKSLITGKLQRMVDNIRYANQLQRFDYTVKLVAKKDPNAFTPGCGIIYVTEGLIPITVTEAQMAMVLAHEMALGEEGHSVERRRDITAIATMADTAANLLGPSFGASPATKQLTALGLSTVLSQYSQSAEREADIVGLGYYVRAGYRPASAPEVFQNMHDQLGSNPVFLNAVSGSHPRAADRAERLRGFVREMAVPPRDGTDNTTEWEAATRAYR